ncbi:MAG: MmcQ/YjbR family DNA-binding protein [Ferruginibacter sp.]|nr:MmcQ/YjbR family DNA-binding protein [Ferruginibacter sp.]
MNIEIFRDYCLSKNAVTESFPFSKLPEALVFKVADKMFTVTYISAFDSIALKCDSELIDELKAQYSAVGKPPYFDEKHWISVSMDGSVPDKKIMEWIDNSYNLVVAKLPKSAKAKFNL